jgi:SAM-dependent methyltransferase
MSWLELQEWWINEIRSDPAYESVVTPLLLDVLRPEPSILYLDLGCGEGRVMETVVGFGARVHGVDINRELAGRASKWGPSMVGELPSLDYIRNDSYDGAYCVLVLEHIPNHRRFFCEVARVVRPEGVLALVMNHPIWTAPGSTPITDSDGEVLWRSGAYFSAGSTQEGAGEETVTFHHRTTGELLNSAAIAGWTLEQMIELPHHDIEEQQGIPRLLACRWRLLP